MQSSPTQYASMYVTARKQTDPAGVMEDRLVKAGDGFNLDLERPAGDFSGISQDPVMDDFWAANEYAHCMEWPHLAN